MTLKDNLLLKINQLDDHEHFLTTCLHQLVDGQDLDTDTMQLLMGLILAGQCPDVLLSAIITALKIKGESTTEIASATQVMRAFAHAVDTPYDVVDIVGTGGDGANLFNVSTACMFVLSAAQVKVAKHGSTGVSTRSGASDLLANAGFNLTMTSEQVAKSIDITNVGFMFAPNHHPAMRHAKAVRATLKMRTLFNLLGPLSNPAGAKRGVFGAYSVETARSICQTLTALHATHILAVHATDGLDEISLSAPTHVFESKNGVMREYLISPTDFGFELESLDELKVQNSEQSLAIITHALQGQTDPTSQKAKKIIALNAGATLYVAGVAESLAEGVDKAMAILDTDLAYQKMQQFIQFSQSV